MVSSRRLNFEPLVAACTHLACAFRACSMSSRAPTYWGQKVGGVSPVLPARPPTPDPYILLREIRANKGRGQDGGGVEIGGANYQGAGPVEPQGQGGRAAGGRGRNQPEGAWPRWLARRGSRARWPLAAGTTLLDSGFTRKHEIPYLF